MNQKQRRRRVSELRHAQHARQRRSTDANNVRQTMTPLDRARRRVGLPPARLSSAGNPAEIIAKLEAQAATDADRYVGLLVFGFVVVLGFVVAVVWVVLDG